jgi:uncharacterized protein (DUF302 family)
MRSFFAIVIVIASLVLPAHASDALVVKQSQHTVKVTLNRLEKILLSKGIKIMGRINHAEGAKAVGLELPETELLIFGNPKLGTPLMQSNPQIGAVLPMKVLVWKAKDGRVYIGYTAPDTLKARFEITGHDEIFTKMTKALDAITSAAAAKG